MGSTTFALVRAAATAAGAALAASVDLPPVPARAQPRLPPAAGASAGGGSSTIGHEFIHASSNSGDINGGIPAIGVVERDEQQQQPGCAGVSGATNGVPVTRVEVAQAAVSQARSGDIYSPRSVTQAVTFNIARALGRAAGRQKPEDN